MIPLSVLDQSPIRSGGSAAEAIDETIALAGLAERLGYQRFWVSEHHAASGLAGVSPEVLLARLGAETRSIRIGSGGVMLPHYSPLKVAENFKLLETMYPGRIDLAVGRAPGSDRLTAQALAYGNPVGPEHFASRVADLAAFLRDQPPHTTAFAGVRAAPEVACAPALWMLGSSEDSAYLAARFGLPYSFAWFINAGIRDDIFGIYRRNFQPSAFAEKPYASLGVFVICADTEAQAQRLARSRDLWYVLFARGADVPPIPSVEEAELYPYTDEELTFSRRYRRQMVLGAPEQVIERLEELARRFDVDELVVVSITHDFKARCRSYELLAQARDRLWASG